MKIIRVKDQGWVTLEEHYTEIVEHSSKDYYRQCAKSMLDLISKLQAFTEERVIYAYTMRYFRLFLSSMDSCEAPWSIIIDTGECDYDIIYRMPEHLAPWPDAYVRGRADSVNQAVAMVFSAMERSEGWKVK